MGLDIYLYTAEHAAANRAYNEASEAFYGRPDYDSLTEAEREAARQSMPKYAPHVDVPSERYPEHLFNRRYLRSSYNGGGFNNAVPQLLAAAPPAPRSSDPRPTISWTDPVQHEADIAKARAVLTDATNAPEESQHDRGSLYWIFEPMGREWDGDEGALTVADVDRLRASKARALEVVEALRSCDRLRALTVGHNPFIGVQKHDDGAALRLYREAVAADRVKPDDWWANRDMEVFGGGVGVLAAVPGVDALGSPAVHMVYRMEDDGFDSYIQSAEITAEFCDEAIALIERDGSCSMSWSG